MPDSATEALALARCLRRGRRKEGRVPRWVTPTEGPQPGLVCIPKNERFEDHPPVSDPGSPQGPRVLAWTPRSCFRRSDLSWGRGDLAEPRPPAHPLVLWGR